MKKSLLAAAALCVMGGTASAQSSVTMYGVLDQGLGYTNNVKGKNQLNVGSGHLPHSVWGLRGSEDLGAGLHAIFQLESNVNLSNSDRSGGGLMGRQSYVGLSSATAGTLTLGRQFNSLTDFVGPTTMARQWAGYLGAHPNDMDDLYAQQGQANTVKYRSANYDGMSFGGTISPGGKAGSLGANLAWSIGANYSNGPIKAGAAFSKAKFEREQQRIVSEAAEQMGLDEQLRQAAAFVDARLAAQRSGGQTEIRSKQVAAVGGSYAFGPAVVGLTYSHSKWSAYDVKEEAKADSIEANVQYRMTPALMAGLGYNYTQLKGGDQKLKFHQVTLGTQYDLSKRTAVYLTGAFQQGKGHAQINTLDASSTNRQVAVRTGIRHSF